MSFGKTSGVSHPRQGIVTKKLPARGAKRQTLCRRTCGTIQTDTGDLSLQMDFLLITAYERIKNAKEPTKRGTFLKIEAPMFTTL